MHSPKFQSIKRFNKISESAYFLIFVPKNFTIHPSGALSFAEIKHYKYLNYLGIISSNFVHLT